MGLYEYKTYVLIKAYYKCIPSPAFYIQKNKNFNYCVLSLTNYVTSFREWGKVGIIVDFSLFVAVSECLWVNIIPLLMKKGG